MFSLLKEGNKRGQESIGMSFNMIFSIFIIIVIIAVAAVVLVKFIDTSKCADTGLFYNDLQSEINKARSGDEISYVYESELKNSGALKSGLSYVCFGNSTSSVARQSNDENIRRNFTRLSRNTNFNVFLYPPEKACDGLESKKIEYVNIDNFFCINIRANNGNVKILLKSEDGSPVKITKA